MKNLLPKFNRIWSKIGDIKMITPYLTGVTSDQGIKFGKKLVTKK